MYVAEDGLRCRGVGIKIGNKRQLVKEGLRQRIARLRMTFIFVNTWQEGSEWMHRHARALHIRV